MVPRTRVLIGSVAAALAWMIGYGMGGGFRFGGKGGASIREESAATGRGASGQGAGVLTGTAGSATGTIEEQLAGRHAKWTKERLRTSITAIGREPDMIHAARFAIQLTEQFGPGDFPLALTAITDAKDELGEEGEIFVMLALARWADLDPHALGEFLRSENRLEGKWLFPSDMELTLGSWAARDVPGAMAWVKSLKDKEHQRSGIKAILGAVARRDVDEAIALAKAHAPEFLEGNDLAEVIGRAMNRGDHEKAVRKLAALGDTADITPALQRWSNQNARAAFQWAEELPEGRQRTEAMKTVWPQFARNQPEEAAAKLEQAAADAPFVAGAAEAIIKTLTEKNPQSAARWTARFPQHEAREEAHAALGEFYGNTNPIEGAQWLEGLDPGEGRDRAIARYVSKTGAKDPAAATDWAVTIADSDRRIAALRGTLGQWFGKSPAAAIEWLQNSTSITDEDRQAILKKE